MEGCVARERPAHRACIENVDLVAFRIFGERNVDGVPSVAVAARAAGPCEADARRLALCRDVHGSKRPQRLARHRRDDLRDGRIRVVATGGTDPVAPGLAEILQVRCQRCDGLVELDEQRPCGHRARGLGLRCPQGRAGSARGDSCARRSAPPARRKRFPSARRRRAARTDCRPASAASSSTELSAPEESVDVEDRAADPSARAARAGAPSSSRPITAGRSRMRCRRIARAVAGAPDRDGARPGIGGDRDILQGGGIAERQPADRARPPAACRAPAADASPDAG